MNGHAERHAAAVRATRAQRGVAHTHRRTHLPRRREQASPSQGPPNCAFAGRQMIRGAVAGRARTAVPRATPGATMHTTLRDRQHWSASHSSAYPSGPNTALAAQMPPPRSKQRPQPEAAGKHIAVDDHRASQCCAHAMHTTLQQPCASHADACYCAMRQPGT
jgi:hypothetical protein